MAIEPTDDHVVRVPEGVEAWSENLFFLPFDFQQEYGVAMHMGRSGQDSTFWREFVHIYLPDGQALVSKTFGNHVETDNRITANFLTYECIEPFRRWRATFDGLARPVSRADLLGGVSVEGTYVRTQFEFEFESMFTTPWQAHTSPGPTTGGAFNGPGSFHYEQVCTSSGELTVEGKTVELDCRGFRDHTRGVRKFSKRSGHTLLSGSFEDGMIAGMYEVRALDGTPNFSQGFTVEDGVPHDADVVRVPHFTTRDVPPDFEVVLRTHDGREVSIEGSPITTTPMTIVAPNDMFHGMSRDDDEYGCLLSPARLTCNGVAGAGHLELSTLNELIS